LVKGVLKKTQASEKAIFSGVAKSRGKRKSNQERQATTTTSFSSKFRFQDQVKYQTVLSNSVFKIIDRDSASSGHVKHGLMSTGAFLNSTSTFI